MGPRCSSAETQVGHRSYIIAAKLTGMRKRAGRKEHKEKDREDGGRMVKR
jgi:hypothetical protein